MRGLAICVLASGCDFLFQLQELDPPQPPDAPIVDDVDRDGWTDVGDNCPAIANQNQLDMDQDQIGDACDPHPTDPHDVVVSQTLLLDMPSDWVPLGDWTIERGRWTSNDPDVPADITFANGMELDRPTVQMGFTIIERSTSQQNQNLEIDVDAPTVSGDCDFRFEPTTNMSKIVLHAGAATDGRTVTEHVVGTRYIGAYTRDLTSRCSRDGSMHELADQVSRFRATPTIGARYLRVAIDHITLYQVVP